MLEQNLKRGIRVVGKGSWKEEEVGKRKKLESFKLESLKLERAKRSWKEPSEVGKNSAKLERTRRSWKEPSEVRKFLLKLESFAEIGKFR